LARLHAGPRSNDRESIARKFAPWIEARYGAHIELEAQFAGLMQSEPDYTGHSCHTRHYHNPNWVGTALIYLDADAAGHPGTMIYRSNCKDIESEAHLAANALHWLGDPNISEVIEVGYERNKMFVFFDSPISYHGVKASADGHGNRRIMRFHLGVENKWLQERYGCTIAEYRQNRLEDRFGEDVMSWMIKDITEYRAVTV
jgi:hypothetical protein